MSESVKTWHTCSYCETPIYSSDETFKQHEKTCAKRLRLVPDTDGKMRCSKCGGRMEIRTTIDGAREAFCSLCSFCLFIFQGGKARG